MSAPCIENSRHPLVFRQDTASPLELFASGDARRLHFRTAARALADMQKEALINVGLTRTTWRVVSDEGPWLNGTDLAPFPLGFFSAGLTASYMSEFLTHAQRAGVGISGLEVVVDNRYGMEGSLLRGTMVGSAFPVEAAFRAVTSADVATVLKLGNMAVASSPADALLRDAIESRFTLNHNGQQVAVTGTAAATTPGHADPDPLFEQAQPSARGEFADGIMERLDDVDILGGDRPGSVRASSTVGLSENQKRQVRVRCAGTLREDGLKDLQVACFEPVGSVFRLLSDDSTAVGGRERAPSGLAYVSAGISFCLMTQLGRYAQVAKHRLRSYRTVQDTSFSAPAAINDSGSAPASAAVSTDVFIDDDEDADKAHTLLGMGEQTCYLHAACRTGLETRVRAD